jgi:hypothetical protein
LGPSRRAKSGSTADTVAGGPLDGVTVTILNADKRIGMHMFTTVARNDAGPPATAHSYADRGGILILIGALHRGRLHDDDTTFLDDPVREATATARTVDADHGRIETRTATVSTAIA